MRTVIFLLLVTSVFAACSQNSGDKEERQNGATAVDNEEGEEAEDESRFIKYKCFDEEKFRSAFTAANFTDSSVEGSADTNAARLVMELTVCLDEISDDARDLAIAKGLRTNGALGDIGNDQATAMRRYERLARLRDGAH